MMPTTLTLFAAGSLSAAMGQIVEEFQSVSRSTVTTRFGAAGGLRASIEAGELCDVFASANMDHPRALRDSGRAGDVFHFAGNTMCAVLRPGLEAELGTLRRLMECETIRIGTSTPIHDPSGDYALNILQKAGVDPSSERVIIVTGGRDKKIKRPDGLSDYTGALLECADIVLLYKTAAARIIKELPGACVVGLPPKLVQRADYGMTTINPASSVAIDFVGFVLGNRGQEILTQHGFEPSNLTP